MIFRAPTRCAGWGANVVRIAGAVKYGVIAGLLAAGLCALSGCGSGGGGATTTTTTTGTGTGTSATIVPEVSGKVGDQAGREIVNALVAYNGITSRSSQFGTYALQKVPVGSEIITATATVGTKTYTGRTALVVTSTAMNTANVDILVSDASLQGSITGTVTDKSGNPIAGAIVFASLQASNNTSLPSTPIGTAQAITNINGQYTLAQLPPYNFTLTASHADYVNSTVTQAVTTSASPTVSFALTPTATAGALTVPTDLEVFSFTLPSSPTRAANSWTAGALDLLRGYVYTQHGITPRHTVAAANITSAVAPTRATPAGFIIEDDVIWTPPTGLTNLYGYSINRSTAGGSFSEIAVLRDPLADNFTDVDTTLTPDTSYYYAIAELDNVAYPANGSEGSPTIPTGNPQAVVEPLGGLTVKAPGAGVDAGSTPTFSWNAVNRASQYTVMVFNKFPSKQPIDSSDTDPDSVSPIWSQTVNASNLSVVYSGPAIAAGTTYFWYVFAADGTGSFFSASAIGAFNL